MHKELAGIAGALSRQFGNPQGEQQAGPSQAGLLPQSPGGISSSSPSSSSGKPQLGHQGFRRWDEATYVTAAGSDHVDNIPSQQALASCWLNNTGLQPGCADT